MIARAKNLRPGGTNASRCGGTAAGGASNRRAPAIAIEQGLNHATGHLHRMHQRPDQPALYATGLLGDLVGHLLGGLEQHENVEQCFFGTDTGAHSEGVIGARRTSGGGLQRRDQRTLYADNGQGMANPFIGQIVGRITTGRRRGNRRIGTIFFMVQFLDDEASTPNAARRLKRWRLYAG